MKEIAAYIYRSDLVKAVGKTYREVLKSLVKEGFIKGYKDMMEIRMDKDKAVHFQSALAFHSAKELPAMSMKHSVKKEDD